MPTYGLPTSWMMLLAVVLLGLIGALIVSMILRSWRRYDDRLRPPHLGRSRRPDTPAQDLWKLSGQRLLDRIDQARQDGSPDRDEEETDENEG